jgi:ankyrin repeat protein
VPQGAKLTRKEIINNKTIGKYYKETMWSICTTSWSTMPLGKLVGGGKHKVKITVHKAESKLKNYDKTVYFYVDKPDAKLMKSIERTPKEIASNKKRILIRNLIDANETNTLLLPLRKALDQNSFTQVKTIIEEDNNITVDTNMVFERRVLHYSAFHNNLELTKYLIDKGADIHHQDRLGKNALAYAIENNATKTAKLLLDSGMDVNDVLFVQNYLRHRLSGRYIKKTRTLSPLQYTSSNALFEMTELLLEYNITDNAISPSGLLEKKGTASNRLSMFLDDSTMTEKEKDRLFEIYKKYNFTEYKYKKSKPINQIGY